MNLLPTVEINPSLSPIGSIIWLHGLGADGSDFAPIVNELNLPKELPLRFIFPHAPKRPVTINQGYVMRAWYDIVAMSIDHHADQAGIDEAVKHIEQLIINEENRGIAAENIILGGFSQGAVIALNTGLLYSKKLRGILALSGYLPFSNTLFTKVNPANQTTPIFLAHGTGDTVVPYFLGEALHQMLLKQGYPISWHSYSMPHSVCPEEIRDIAAWIQQIFNHPNK